MKKILACAFAAVMTCSITAQTYQIGHTTINFTDASRGNRVIQTEIYYPANTTGDNVPVANGQFPVIIFGHGFVMIWSAYQNLWEEFVPLGYIMAFPRTEGNISPSHSEFGKDLRFLVYAMQNEGITSSSIFFGAVKNKSAIMGHSMGGGASILAAANNSSIETVVGMAPAETNPSAKAAGDSVTVDALVLVGSQDGVAPPASHGIPIYDTLSSPCKNFINITGGAHCYFANSNFNCDFGESTSSTGISITRAHQQQTTYDFVNLWLDYKLKDDCNAFEIFNDSLVNSQRITHQQNCCSSVANPVISENSGTLSCSASGLSYQWFLNGNVITGANFPTYSPSQDGNYSVEIVFDNCCKKTSAQFNFSLVTINGNLKNRNSFTLFPNPANSRIFLDFNSEVLKPITVKIFNSQGKVVREFLTNNSFQFDIAELMQGIYFVLGDGLNLHSGVNFIKQ